MRIIEVIANPYIALDKDGVPQGVVSAGMPGAYIGAQLDLVATQKGGKPRFFFPANADGSLAKRVHLDGRIAQAVLAGDLLVANKKDAAACGLSEADFLEPDAALAAEREKALTYYRRLHGPGAQVADVPRAAETLEPGDELPIKTSAVKLTPELKMTKEA